MNRPLYFSTCFALVVIASILPVMSATAGPSIRTDDDENGRLHFPIVRGNRNSNPAKAIDSAGLDTEILSHSDINNDSFAENTTHRQRHRIHPRFLPCLRRWVDTTRLLFRQLRPCPRHLRRQAGSHRHHHQFPTHPRRPITPTLRQSRRCHPHRQLQTMIMKREVCPFSRNL